MSTVVRHAVSSIAVCFFAFAIASAGRAELPEEIRVLTYNIHHGEGVDGKFDLPRIARVIKGASPHLVALQEVDRGTQRAGGVDQPAELARLTGMEVVFGRNIDYDGGGYGTAVLSRLPIRSHESVKLRSFYEDTAAHPEQRGVQIVEVGREEGPALLFLCTHLDYRQPDTERMASAATINQLAAKHAGKLMILAGDLNATPESRVMAEFAKNWKIAGADVDAAKPQAAGTKRQLLTYPAGQPVKWIDYVLVRPAERWQVVEVRVLDEPVASDHRPLLAVLRAIEIND